MQRLYDKFKSLCWVAYSPTRFDPTSSPLTWPSRADILQDLEALYGAGFRGLVTYNAGYRGGDHSDKPLDVARLAEQVGFRGMIVGVWDPLDRAELNAALEMARVPIVLGYSVGNEGLGRRYDLKQLTNAMQFLRATTGNPVTTSEELHDYDRNSPLWRVSDWIFPNAHPYFAGEDKPTDAVAWTQRVFEALDLASEKPLVFKEVGLPSAGVEHASESNQAQYYRELRRTGVVFVVFEAFDAPWKRLHSPTAHKVERDLQDPEPHWGIFTNDREPKAAVQWACHGLFH